MITSQIGMFAYTGMTEAMCDESMAKCVLCHSIYASIYLSICYTYSKDWAMITSQIGMFAYTGMTEAMCDELMAKCVAVPQYICIHPPIHPSIYLSMLCV